MPMDGIVLHHIVKEMKKGLPFKINRITQPSKHEFVFNGFNGQSTQLLISTHPNTARMQWTKHRAEMNIQATHLVSLFRKHLEGGNLIDIRQDGFDRILEIVIENRDDLGVMQTYYLYLELLGRFANLILTDKQQQIFDCVIRQNDFESNARVLLPGVTYQRPERTKRKSPYDLELLDVSETMFREIEGFSPALSKAFSLALEKGADFTACKEALLHSEQLYIYEEDFHVVALPQFYTDAKILPLMEGLDYYFEQRSINQRIEGYTDAINRQVRKELKREKRRLRNLNRDLELAHNAESLKLSGELLYTYGQDLKAGHEKVTLQDFEGNPVEIELKVKLNGVQNAQDYFKRYQKAKRSLHHLEREIKKAELNIDYFNTILVQIKHASLKDALEIREELIEAKILKKQKVNPRKRKKEVNHRVLNLENAQILIGKNNTQNDYITFKLAHKKDLWFHVAHAPGSHVVLKTTEVNDELIEIAASLAAYFSGNKNSENIDVNYTEVKNLKKIPGAPKGMVAMDSFKTVTVKTAPVKLLEMLE